MTETLAIQNSPQNLSAFHAHVDHLIVKAWATSDMAEHLEAMTEGAKQLAEEIIKTGDSASEFLITQEAEIGQEHAAAYVINFVWSERAKSFLILWRNVLFQQQKAEVLLEDGSVSKEEVRRLKEASKTALQKAFQELKAFPEEELGRIRNSKKGLQGQIDVWKLQANPWPTYRTQIEEIPKQCTLLLAQFKELQIAAATFEDMRQTAKDTIAACHKEIEVTRKTADSAIVFIQENIKPDEEHKPGKIAARLEDMEADLKISNHMYLFTERIELLDKKLSEKLRIVIGTNGGMLQYKQINLQKKVQDWMESEILPVLYEVWEVTENVSNGLKISLINIRNRALLASSEFKSGKQASQLLELSDYTLPLQGFLKKATTAEEGMAKFEKQIFERLDTQFRLKEVYGKQEEFLKIPLASTINQFKINQNAVVARVQNWFTNKWVNVQHFIRSVEEEEALSLSEKIVRLIQSRTNSTTNSYYSSIFMTKGYIGESFWVGRESELQRVKALVDQWTHGFRGAIAVTGQRFSGKTLFGELVAHRHFPENTIRLMPNQSIIVEGRRFMTTHNLGEVLNFVRKHTVNIRPMILIDDLEHWWDTTIPLSENVRSLRRYIDNYGGRHFVVVNMSNWLKHHLDQVYELDKVFQAEINMDEMRVQEVREAILIRHGATHKQLVDEEGKDITPAQFRKLTNQIYKTSEGNVGEALNRWTATISRYDEERVVQNFKGNFQLPDFINADNGMMLTALMMEKRTTEYHLRKLFGAAFNDKYRTILQRLISVGLLTRHLDGWLEINDAAVNDLGRLLEEKGYLKFHY
jgi:hypothetical protein